MTQRQDTFPPACRIWTKLSGPRRRHVMIIIGRRRHRSAREAFRGVRSLRSGVLRAWGRRHLGETIHLRPSPQVHYPGRHHERFELTERGGRQSIQLVANALSDGHAAVWVDCSFSVCGQRLKDVAQAIREARSTGSASEPTTSGLIAEKFTHYSCPTLAHLIALLCRPTATTLPKDTAVVVVSSLSTLVNHAFPKSSENRPGPQLGKGPSLAARRLQTLQHIVSALQKLAATRNCAVVVLTQCATKMQAESDATLVPAINANVWEQGVSTRLVVFKDWAWKDGRPSTVCLAGVQKLEGRAGSEAVSSAAAFRIEAAGLIALEYDASQPSVVLTSTPRRKRKLDDAGLEVPDSDEGEGDYGWEVDDDAAAPVPPQTQGSEDLLLGVNHGLYDEDDGESDDDEAGGDRVVLDSEDDGGLVNDRDSGDGSEAEDELGPGPGHGQQGGLDGASAGPDSLNSGTDRR